MLKEKQNKKNNFCTQHVLNLYFYCNSMNNLSSYFGLTDTRIRAFDTDLPVAELFNGEKILLFAQTYLRTIVCQAASLK